MRITDECMNLTLKSVNIYKSSVSISFSDLNEYFKYKKKLPDKKRFPCITKTWGFTIVVH